MENKKGLTLIKFLAIIGILSVLVGITLTIISLVNKNPKTNSLEEILISKKIGSVVYGTVPTKGGLYYWSDQNKYIFRGGITINNSSGTGNLDNDQYSGDTYNKATDINNYIKVPWENNTFSCESVEEPYYTPSPCWRIMSINQDGSITIVKDQNLSTSQVFDNTYNTSAIVSQDGSLPEKHDDYGSGYNDLLSNVPTTGHPEEYRQYSQMYYRLYGASGYQNSTLKNYYQLLQPLDVCLNKANEYIGINHYLYAGSDSVKNTCDLTGANLDNVKTVKPLQNQYVRLPYTEEYLNASLQSNCTTDYKFQCRGRNFMYNKSNYWSLNGSPVNSYCVRHVNVRGHATTPYADESYGVRPVVNLKSSILITGGTGTATNPYIISP